MDAVAVGGVALQGIAPLRVVRRGARAVQRLARRGVHGLHRGGHGRSVRHQRLCVGRRGVRLPAAVAYARANRLNHLTQPAAPARLGLLSAGKSFQDTLQALADELKDSGVTVNAVLPSILDTPTNRADMPKADPSAWVRPADLAAVMLFLASEAAGAVTGALIPVTGRV